MQLPTVTYEQFLKFRPCWLETEKGKKRLARYGRLKPEWTALDVLELNRVSPDDRLWAVLREEFIPAPLLHEFACRCAEQALRLVEQPDPRSIAAINAKRAWLRGEIDDEKLAAAWAAAQAAARDAAWDSARAAAWAAARAAAQAEQIEILKKMLMEE